MTNPIPVLYFQIAKLLCCVGKIFVYELPNNISHFHKATVLNCNYFLEKVSKFLVLDQTFAPD